MRYLLLGLLVACRGKASTSTEPLGVLRAPNDGWLYELVSGASIDALAPVAGTPNVKCKIGKPEGEQDPGQESTWIDCAPRARVDDPNGFGGALYQRRFLVFDVDGVRELPGVASPIYDKSYALAFTFPSKLDGATWSYDRGDGRIHSKVDVRVATMNVLGKDRPVWISSSTYHWNDAKPDTLDAAMFAPGVAPVLLCTHDEASTSWCLRIVGTAEPSKARPKPSPKVPSQQERDELVKMLTTMDHTGDFFDDRMYGQLAVRDDLPITAGEQAPVIEVDPRGARIMGKPVTPEGLAETASAIERNIDRGLVSRTTDRVKMREQLILVIDAKTPWQRVREVLDTAAGAGFVQPLFVFARTPGAPRPPRTWVDDAFDEARLDNEAASFLGKVIKDILADCEPLREAFALGDASSVPKADQLIAALAERIPKTACIYDIAALRSALWLTLGTPYPHSSSTIRIAPTGQRVDLAPDEPWRDASRKLRDGMTVRFH